MFHDTVSFKCYQMFINGLRSALISCCSMEYCRNHALNDSVQQVLWITLYALFFCSAGQRMAVAKPMNMCRKMFSHYKQAQNVC